MNVRKLYEKLEERIPRALSCEWDNDGLMCCPCGDEEVDKVLVALDVTAEVIEYAKNNGYDVILSHHPFIFNGIKAFDDREFLSSKVLSVVGAGISVMSFHTRLDAVEGGVNDKLASLLGLCNTEPVYCEGIPLGRVGTISTDMNAEDFARKVKEVLGAPFVLLADAGVPVKKVAVVGGGGGSFIGEAKRAAADTFVSGCLDYHAMTDAPDQKTQKINLIEAGHFFTEHPVCSVLRDFVLEINPELECDVYCSNVIKAI